MASKSVETASESGNAGSSQAPSRAGRGAFAAAARGRLASLARRHAATVAAAVAVVGGLLLLYAETLDLYRIVTPSGSVSNAAGSVRTGGDQHSWALAVVGVAGAGAVVLGRATRQRAPALAAVLLGVIALVVVLAFDLPDVTASGVTTDLEVGDAEPGPGFWTEAGGAIAMTAGAAALAWLLGPGAGRPAPRRERAGAGR